MEWERRNEVRRRLGIGSDDTCTLTMPVQVAAMDSEVWSEARDLSPGCLRLQRYLLLVGA